MSQSDFIENRDKQRKRKRRTVHLRANRPSQIFCTPYVHPETIVSSDPDKVTCKTCLKRLNYVRRELAADALDQIDGLGYT